MEAPFVRFIYRRRGPHAHKRLSLAALCQKPALFPSQWTVLLSLTKLDQSIYRFWDKLLNHGSIRFKKSLHVKAAAVQLPTHHPRCHARCHIASLASDPPVRYCHSPTHSTWLPGNSHISTWSICPNVGRTMQCSEWTHSRQVATQYWMAWENFIAGTRNLALSSHSSQKITV